LPSPAWPNRDAHHTVTSAVLLPLNLLAIITVGIDVYVSYNEKEKREEKEVCGDCFKLRVAYVLQFVCNVSENFVFFLNSVFPRVVKGTLFKDAPEHRITVHDRL
jgi:hypothetical protein